MAWRERSYSLVNQHITILEEVLTGRRDFKRLIGGDKDDGFYQIIERL